MRLKFKQKWDEALKNQTSAAYKATAKMASAALMKMMGSAENETLAVVWDFSEGSIVANTSMPLMEDDVTPVDVKNKLETFDLSSIPDLAEISAEESPGMIITCHSFYQAFKYSLEI